MEFLAGTGLAVAAGLNAYVPLLVLGLAGRFIEFVELPTAWAWLSDPWVLGILGVLLVIEVIADKIPLVDSVNDWIQTVIRPAAGGIAFGTGTGTTTAIVQDPGAFFTSNNWVPIVIGILLALATHVAKAVARPAANAVTAGAAAPIISLAEDLGSVILSLAALLLPVLVVLGVGAVVFGFIVLVRRATGRTQKRPAPEGPTV